MLTIICRFGLRVWDLVREKGVILASLGCYRATTMCEFWALGLFWERRAILGLPGCYRLPIHAL